MRPPDVLLSLRYLALAFLLFRSLLVILQYLLHRRSDVRRSDCTRFLNVVTRINVARRLQRSAWLHVNRLSHRFNDTVIHLRRDLSVITGTRRAFVRDQCRQFRIRLPFTCDF